MPQVVEPNTDALHVALGYAFTTLAFQWRSPRDGVGKPPSADSVGRWAYRTYDCIPASPGPRLSDADVLIANGLNGRMGSAAIASLLAVRDAIAPSLEAIANANEVEEFTFWNLDESDVADKPGTESTPMWHMWRAWALLMGAPHVDVAITHKTLHHKMPSVFPLLDNLTLKGLNGEGGAWRQIHHDLRAAPEKWAAFEDAFNEQARHRQARELTRLRLHDIVLWCRESGNYEEALKAGRQLAPHAEL